MSDRDRLAAVVYDELPQRLWRGWLAYRIADRLLAAGVTMPAEKCPGITISGVRIIDCKLSKNHDGECR